MILSSIVTPWEFVLMNVFNVDNINFVSVLEYFLYKFVLFKFNDNLFLSNHFSVVIISNNCWRFSPEQKIFASSANNTSFNILHTLHLSLMYRINCLEPNSDPWETPQAMSKHLGENSQLQNCCLPLR